MYILGFSPEADLRRHQNGKSVECLFIDTFLEKFKNATSILSLLAFGGITELEMTYATLNIKIYHRWLYMKDYLSPLLAKKKCGVWYLSSARVRSALMSTIPLKELKNARALIIRILKSRRYNALNRIADALPPLVRDKQPHCIMKPPIFENLVCEERRPFLMQYLDELNLRVFDFVRLLRSLESYYNRI